MRRALPICLVLILVSIAVPALAQTTGTSSGFNISWTALNPGTDWAWQMIQSVFPISGSPPTSTGAEATVIGKIVGQLTGFVLAIAMAFVCYLTIMNIHRVAETTNLLSRGMTSMFLVRIGFAAIMMFPLTSGSAPVRPPWFRPLHGASAWPTQFTPTPCRPSGRTPWSSPNR